MKNTRKRTMKGGGCGCSSGSLLGFPQSGGQFTKMLSRRREGLPMNSTMPGMASPMSNSGTLTSVGDSQGRPGRLREVSQSNVSGQLATIQAKLNSINAKLGMSKSQGSSGLFGGGQNGGFLGFFENNPSPPTNVQPSTNSPTPVNNVAPMQNVVKMPAVTATNSGSAEQRIRNLEQRLAQVESSKGGFSFFGGGRKRKTRKANKKRRSSRK